MAKYYECPTNNIDCPYWDWKRHKCSMEVIHGDGEGPAGQCDEYDAYNNEEEEE